MLALELSFWGNVFLQVVVCKFACLFEAIHAFSDFSIDMPIVFQRLESVLLNNILWDQVDWYVQIFISFHWGPQVKTFNVTAHELRLLGVHDTVEQ